MAYQTGTPTDLNDLVNTILKPFLTSEGWTLNDDNWPNHLALANGQCFLSMRRSPTTGNNTFNDAFGVSRTDNRILSHLASAYSGAGGTPDARYAGQPDSLVTSTGDADAVEVNDLGETITKYHFFTGGVSDPDYCYVVVETDALHYTHLWFGNLDKLGATYAAGGAFLGGTFYEWWPDSTTESQREDIEWEQTGSAHKIAFSYQGSNQHIYCGDAVPSVVMTKGKPVYRRFNSLAAALGSSVNGYFADPIFALGQNPLNGVTPGLPLPALVAHSSVANAFQVIGVLPNLRLCSLKGRYAGEEITIGADTWVCFPFRKQEETGLMPAPTSPALSNTSSQYGVMIKKVI